jgi:hypothetical protein
MEHEKKAAGAERALSGPEPGADGPGAPPAQAGKPELRPTDLEALVDAFVQRHAGMKQRDPQWVEATGTTVGGSELAKLMGMDPYGSFYDVVRAKVALRTGQAAAGGPRAACWWGIVLEDVISAYTALDLGAPVKGDDICIRTVAGHRNSPDGYIVARLCQDGDGRRLWTTADPPGEAHAPQVLLLEFKCPLSRRPTAGVPRQYRPQLWSGLAVSPVAHKGLFVDAVFRRCRLADLGDTPAYDTAYHSKGAGWDGPVAWGLLVVYAPAGAAPAPPSGGERDAAGLGAGEPCARDLVDLGAADADLFEQTLGLLAEGPYRAQALPPCFADGRGHDLRTDGSVAAELGRLCRAAPEGYRPFGVFPWKLFEVVYALVERRPGFLDEVRPLIDEVHEVVAAACASDDPEAYVCCREAAVPKAGSRAFGRRERPGADETAVQALFDSLPPAREAGGTEQKTRPP